MSWNYYKRRDCPVCNGKRKDCRQNSKTGLIHCRDVEAEPKNYIFRGYDSLGFGMWADKVEVEAWTEEKRREWEEQRQRERELEKARLNRLLSDFERDRTIRAILKQLSLNPEHRTKLQLRGMSDEQIESGMYRSVERWQKLEYRVDDRLAGVSRGGKGLNVPASGIICPIPNHQGQLVGWQLRFDEPGELPKYLWASCEKKRRQNGPSVHLKNGELPLAFFAPSTGVHEIVNQWFKDIAVIPVALTEGVAFKPSLTAQRLGIHTIGASGGHFASSPQTLKSYLESIRRQEAGGAGEAGEAGGVWEDKGTRGQGDSIPSASCPLPSAFSIQPILFADAGCLVNANILQVYANTVEKLKEFGYETNIAWWGQVDKQDGDIDEIDDATLASIRLLSYSEFLTLVKKTQRDHQIEAVQQGLQSLSHEPNLRLNTRYLPDLTPTIPLQGIVALKSPKGSGKSVQIKNIIELARKGGMKVISLTPRRALGREQSIKWDIEWGGDTEITGLHRLTLWENLSTLGICWDSLGQLMDRDWSQTLVIVDEAELALVHLLLSSTCKEKRPLILRVLESKLRECLANGGMLLIADADLTDLSIDYFKALVPDAPLFLVTNQYQGRETRWQIDFQTGKKDTAIARLIAALATPIVDTGGERQRRIVIPTDSQDQAEALERFIRERYPHLLTVRIDSTTTETDKGRGFVERPNERILEIQPDVLIYTPSMGAGVSIDVQWFDGMYAFFNGVIEPSQCRQMLGRVRANIPRTIWCRKRGQIEGNTAFLPEDIKSHLFTFHRETSILIDVARAIAPNDPTDWQIRQAYDSIWNRETRAWDNPHVDLYCNLTARKNYGLSHLASELRRQLLGEGHLLIDSEGGGNTDEGLRVAQIKKQLPIEDAQAIALAVDIPLDLALMLKQKPNLTEQQRHQITKALLKAELPGVELTPEFIYKAVTKDGRKWLNAHKLFWYCQHPEQVKVLDRKAWLDHLWQFSHGVVYLPDIRTYSLQVQVLQNIGFFQVIDLDCPEREYCGEEEAIQEMLRKARKFSRTLYTAFNLKVTKKTKPIQFINHLLKRVGLHLKFHRQIAKGQRFYRIDLDKLNDPHRQAVLDSLSQKWGQLGSESDCWESQQTPININNTGSCCDSWVSQQTPVNINNTGSCCDYPATANLSELPEEKLVQISSKSDSWVSQQTSIDINNTGTCCDSLAIDTDSPLRLQATTISSKPNSLASQQTPVDINNTATCCDSLDTTNSSNLQDSTSAKISSKSDFSASQQTPIDINNTGSCCDSPVKYHQATNQINFPELLIPREYREGVLEMNNWLTEAASQDARTLQDFLVIAIEYLKLVPQAKTWLWKTMNAWVKEAIAARFPEYYQLLSWEVN